MRLKWLGWCFIALMATARAGFAGENDLEARLKAAFSNGELEGLHSLLVLEGGTAIAELYFEGEDERWGTPLGLRQHGPDTLHDLRSVTKSIVGLLYGIALSDGIVPGLDESIVAQFPHFPDLTEDPARQAITVRDALNMTMGVEWNEDLPYSDPNNSEIAMEMSDDRFRYVLSRPLIGPPGETWVYNGGATALIGHLIERGSGQRLDDYAQDKLFGPLGITAVDWVNGFDGRPAAASGLRLTARDLARIGQMIVEGGRAGGQQIVPAAWLKQSFTPAVQTTGSLRYAHFWWHAAQGNPPQWVAGFGNGGQRLVINARLGLVLVLFAGNYNQRDAWKLGVKVITEFVVPEVTGE